MQILATFVNHKDDPETSHLVFASTEDARATHPDAYAEDLARALRGYDVLNRVTIAISIPSAIVDDALSPIVDGPVVGEIIDVHREQP